MPYLEVIIVWINICVKLDLFVAVDVLLLLLISQLPFTLVLKFAEVHQLADWYVCIFSDDDQVEPGVLCAS